MELFGENDKNGKRKIKPIPGSEFIMDADSVILAIGQEVDTGFLAKEVDLKLNTWNNVKVDPASFPEDIEDDLVLTPLNTVKVDPITLETNIKGVFSGGDAISGNGTVIEAIAAGKEVAISIDRYINGEDLKEGRGIKPKVAKLSIGDVKRKSKVAMRYLPLEERKNNFDEVELGYTEEEAIEEARRCLNCSGCAECYECVKICKANAIRHDMKEEIIDINVGAIIVATGYDLINPEKLYEYGYDLSPDVITTLELERLISSSGPTKGEILRPSNQQKPKSVTFILCVGSRDETQCTWCCRIGCMSALKHVYLLREKLGEDVEINICYTDIRSYG